MNIETKFLNKLFDLTKQHYITWKPLLDLDQAQDEYDFDTFDFLLFQNEFHQIHTEKSFYGEAEDIALLFLNETFESGVDGSVTSEINLYYARNYKSQPFQLKLPIEQLQPFYELVSKKAFANHIEEGFIEDFLSNH